MPEGARTVLKSEHNAGKTNHLPSLSASNSRSLMPYAPTLSASSCTRADRWGGWDTRRVLAALRQRRQYRLRRLDIRVVIDNKVAASNRGAVEDGDGEVAHGKLSVEVVHVARGRCVP